MRWCRGTWTNSNTCNDERSDYYALVPCKVSGDSRLFLSQFSLIKQRRGPCYWRAKASVSAQCSVTESHNCKQFFKRSVHFLSLKFITMLLCDINEFGVKITFGVRSLQPILSWRPRTCSDSIRLVIKWKLVLPIHVDRELRNREKVSERASEKGSVWISITNSSLWIIYILKCKNT